MARDVVEQDRQPFYVPHDDHAHAFTSALFPALSAPFLSLFGLRGLYVLPAIGWLLIAPLTISLSRRLQTRASPTAIWIGMATLSPFVFYGLEFWEHAPAIAASLGAACLALRTPTSSGALRQPNEVAISLSPGCSARSPCSFVPKRAGVSQHWR